MPRCSISPTLVIRSNGPVDVAIIHQLELDAVGDARLGRALARNSIWSGASATPSTSTS